ncbi:LEAF RUST 10 DISEASE-RESISTANCE LOCUS RECEPTOR-LIKE PROTEIN KINASE-like 2.8 isoform X2 [Prosopis cineraria]|uniref:LEAF RUST 10 DISEASE-RESISTANCE LOCUS RECEPTOR-LIKE PROTEIN KINASE-like 2.8 isoform X2 n=1 Tax=Prosopis cineraria TaxID=364024 RepID=UPI00240F8615|nr:LEAF RUST 10 DISEASE-RESISTANCE LOCUS RECEPTOR-LIKE PROTEIN KINASE-like 2.8 isoform X2 [Prosopis cineraria]
MAYLFTLGFLLSSITLLVLIQVPSYSSAYDYYTACGILYDCGKIRNVGFPFWGLARPQGCGYPELYLNCSGNSTFITIQEVRHLVLDAKPEQQVLRIVRFDCMDDLCPEQFINPILDPQVFDYVRELNYLTLRYGCPSIIPSVKFGQFFCSKNGFDDENGFVLLGKDPGFSGRCNASVLVPVEVPMSLVDVIDLDKVKGAIKNGFEVKWIAGTDECDRCQKSGGACGYDWAARHASCYYKHESSASSSITGYYYKERHRSSAGPSFEVIENLLKSSEPNGILTETS